MTDAYILKAQKYLNNMYGHRSEWVKLDKDEIISVEQFSQNKSSIMYKDIKKVIESKEIILFINKAGFTTFF